MKKNINILLSLLITSVLIACDSKENKNSMNGKILSNIEIINDSDPVCKMPTTEHLKDTLTYEGKLYGFCSTNCKEEFKKNPKKYLEK